MQHFFLGLISMFGHSQRRKAYTWTMGLILTRLQAGLFSYIYFHPPLYRLGQPIMICFLIVYFASVWEAHFVRFPAEAFFFYFFL